ncbi:protease [Rhizobium phage vB_RleM_P10VF]|uniref:HtrA protease/chaperone protein / Ssrine protease n=2 Tax=Innesvirus TaxID=3044739 RepID=A0A7G7WW26_9CAUD|nr:protease [Rhizobium phage vB_RleM_P10VF]YP_010662263.1 protease [Rhizobium phage AF3]AIK68293.1 putative trypsin-like serine protease [Rhizobium phage vB_RleM_P10VF]QNH71420.1 HtrA protease/chaperone protein / Ssrine protease [Rhizobium phage AF3]
MRFRLDAMHEILSVTVAAAVLCLPLVNYKSRIPEAQATVRIDTLGVKGSGVNIGDGMYVTAYHVLERNFASNYPVVTVTNDKGDKTIGVIFAAKPEYDIAILKVAENFTKQVFLDCDELAAGEEVKTIGNPDKFDFFEFEGNISGKKFEYGDWKEVYPVAGTIIPGMSGGAMIDSTGRLAGINIGVQPIVIQGKYLSYSNISFAVPSKVVCDMIDGKVGYTQYTVIALK